MSLVNRKFSEKGTKGDKEKGNGANDTYASSKIHHNTISGNKRQLDLCILLPKNPENDVFHIPKRQMEHTKNGSSLRKSGKRIDILPVVHYSIIIYKIVEITANNWMPRDKYEIRKTKDTPDFRSYQRGYKIDVGSIFTGTWTA
ncbi:MAG: hypothetical protein GY866_30095 [Proteobacteria bacterium]|nr:hypothetical protein [Pseudomonadota bacterium]